MNFKNVSISLFACALSASSMCLAVSHTEDLPNFRRVSNFISTGDAPSIQGTQLLQKRHFGAVIDLRTPSAATVDEQREVERLEMSYVALPVGNGVPTEQQVTKFIQAVEHATRSIGWYPAVYVHGDKGSGAPGCLIAIWHVTHDKWPYKRAVGDAHKYGLGDESTPLAALVKDYADGSKKLSKPAEPSLQ
jgi:hypothetical protein